MANAQLQSVLDHIDKDFDIVGAFQFAFQTF